MIADVQLITEHWPARLLAMFLLWLIICIDVFVIRNGKRK